MVTCPDSTSRGHPNTIWDSSRPYFLCVYIFSSSWLVSFIIKWSLLSAFLSSMSYSNKLLNLRESCKCLYLNSGPQKNGWTGDLTCSLSRMRAGLCSSEACLHGVCPSSRWWSVSEANHSTPTGVETEWWDSILKPYILNIHSI